ncbi:hypothetical protein MTQ17_07175 [Corynebacterium bovis]|uniref:hypothetical protein n=1 Tax=Corynebacterium bovis TaxID=36808 RepID=UPI00313A0801
MTDRPSSARHRGPSAPRPAAGSASPPVPPSATAFTSTRNGLSGASGSPVPVPSPGSSRTSTSEEASSSLRRRHWLSARVTAAGTVRVSSPVASARTNGLPTSPSSSPARSRPTHIQWARSSAQRRMTSAPPFRVRTTGAWATNSPSGRWCRPPGEIVHSGYERPSTRWTRTMTRPAATVSRTRS